MLIDYVAYQGYVDERMERQINLMRKKGWQVRVILNYPGRGWIARGRDERRIIIPPRVVTNSLMNELLFFPLFLGIRYFPSFIRDRNQLSLLYILNFPDALAIPYLVMGWLLGIPRVYEVRDPWKEFIITESEPSALRRARFRFTLALMRLIERTAILLASGVIFATPSFLEVHQAESRKKPRCVINNYSDYSINEELSGQARNLKKSLGLSHKFVVSYIGGSFPPYRGIDTLVKSISIAAKRNPEIRLLITGGHTGSLTAIRDQIRAMEIEDKCVVTGWVPGEKLILYYLVSNVGIIPHKMTPATQLTVPNKLFDYLAVGTPVIITALREQSRYIENGEDGFKVTPDNAEEMAAAVLKIAGDSGLESRMKVNALRKGKEYSFATVERQFLEFISRLAKMV